MTNERSIELEVEVLGTPEEVWQAIATGPGISSWYVPHELEERKNGEALAIFSPEEWGKVKGRVAVWDPPKRIVFDGGEGKNGMAFEWLIEAKDSGTCVVRLVNTGFGSGKEWDDQFDGMTDGWPMFLLNLKLHLEHFRGQSATSMLPTADWALGRQEAWTRLVTSLGLVTGLTTGDRLAVKGKNTPALAGTVAQVDPWRLALIVDDPAPGTAFIAAEGRGENSEMSVWVYLYGQDGAAACAADSSSWSDWLKATAP